MKFPGQWGSHKNQPLTEHPYITTKLRVVCKIRRLLEGGGGQSRGNNP